MSTGTRTGTETMTITCADVRQVMSWTTEEIYAICTRMAQVTREFDVDGALVDCSLLALNDIITAIRLQVYAADEIVSEYSYVIADRPLAASVPPPGQTPQGAVPDRARVRLVVTPNAAVTAEVRDGWFRRLGWQTAQKLHVPSDGRRETYGTFVSGGFGVERQLLVNPKYDRPLHPAALCEMGKGY